MFVNLLALRNRPKEDKRFKDFLEEVKTNALDAFENQDYPFDELVKKLGAERNWTRNPLFDVLFIMQNIDKQNIDKEETPGIDSRDLKLATYRYKKDISPFDLSLEGFENDGIIALRLYYLTSLYKKSTAEYISKHFVEIVKQVVNNRNITLKDITVSHTLSSGKSFVSKEDIIDFEF